jgi:hypothetical protein
MSIKYVTSEKGQCSVALFNNKQTNKTRLERTPAKVMYVYIKRYMTQWTVANLILIRSTNAVRMLSISRFMLLGSVFCMWRNEHILIMASYRECPKRHDMNGKLVADSNWSLELVTPERGQKLTHRPGLAREHFHIASRQQQLPVSCCSVI